MPRRALITSGGGAKGAFTVGALRYLFNNGPCPFEILSGTSTGSLIAALAAVGRINDLCIEYTNVTNDDILTKQNIVNNIIRSRPYLFDTAPLLNLIEKYITQDVFDQIIAPSCATLCLTAISLQTGVPMVFSNRPLQPPPDRAYTTRRVTSRQELITALLASSSQAGFLPPVTFDGQQFVDGGNREVIPTRIVVDLAPDSVYVISNSPDNLFPGAPEYKDVLETIKRAISIFLQDVQENDMRVLNQYCQTNGVPLNQINPLRELDPENITGLRFDINLMTSWMANGDLRARQVVPPGAAGPVIV